MYNAPAGGSLATRRLTACRLDIRSISEISSCFFGPRPWHIEIENSKIEIMETDRTNIPGYSAEGGAVGRGCSGLG